MLLYDKKYAIYERKTMQNKPKGKLTSEAKEWISAIAIAVILAVLIRMFLFETVLVQQTSMKPTLMEGDRLGLLKAAYFFSEPQSDDIVVIKISDTKNYVKRVIAVGGDVIEIKNSTVYVNGEELNENYLPEGLVYSDFPATLVKEGYIFVMGDNRPNSVDSRYLGQISLDNVVGKVIFRFKPFTVYK